MDFLDNFLTGEFNIKIIKLFQSFNNPFLDNFFTLITITGEEYFLILLLTYIFWCKNKKFGYKIGMAILSGTLINISFKEMFKVPRPFNEGGIRTLRAETATGYSFPSGHTQGGSLFWTSIMVHVKNNIFYIIGIVMITLVGISRLYLGVHRPADVVIAIFLGVTWVFISNLIFEHIEKSGNYLFFLFYIIPSIIGCLFIRTADYYKMFSLVISFCLGYIIENKYIRFNVVAKPIFQILKLLVGIGGVLVIKILVKEIMPQHILWDFIRYFMIGLYVTIGAPFIFKKYIPTITSNISEK